MQSVPIHWLILATESTTKLDNPLLWAMLLMTLFGGGFVGWFFYWDLGHRKITEDKFQIRRILWLIGTAGVGTVATWQAEGNWVFAGLSWTLGIIMGFFTNYFATMARFCSEIEAVADPHRSILRGFIKRNVIPLGHNGMETALQERIDQLAEKQRLTDGEATNRLNRFAYEALYEAFSYLRKVQDAYKAFVSSPHPNFAHFNERRHAEFDSYLRKVLSHLVPLFEASSGKTGKIWAAVRVLQSEGREYKTVVRVGNYSVDRQQHSEPVGENEGLPSILRAKYAEGKRIYGFNGRKPKGWKTTANDKKNEDVQVIAAPIVIVSPKEEDTDELYMILYINSLEKNAFWKAEENYLEICSNILSLFLSMTHRILLETVTRVEGEPK